MSKQTLEPRSDRARVGQEARQDRPIPYDPEVDPYDPNDPAAAAAYLNAADVRVRRAGRPPVAVRRQALTMRMDASLLAYLRASGKGWQSRLHRMIEEAVAQGRL